MTKEEKSLRTDRFLLTSKWQESLKEAAPHPPPLEGLGEAHHAQGDNILNRYQQVSGSYEEKNQNRPTLRLKRQTPQNNENAFFIKWFNYLIIKFLKQIFIY